MGVVKMDSTRDQEFQKLFAEAHLSGRIQAVMVQPTMVAAVSETGYTSDPFPICGFAWVNVRPGNSLFATWLKKNNFAHKAFEGGVNIWISEHGQSMDLKYAHAEGMVQIFKLAGIKCYAAQRLD
jgi:hypothetical protein